MNKLKQTHTVAAVQLKASGSAEQNMAAAETQIAGAVEQGTELIVLPEHFVYYNEKDLSAIAALEADPSGLARAFFAEQARKHQIWLVAGTLPMFKNESLNDELLKDESPKDQALKGKDNTRPYACSLLYDPQGNESARYEKIHLFDVLVQATGKRYYESDNYQPGDEPVCGATDVGTLGMSVCYDLRFPEYYRLLVDQGAEILAVPSAFTAATGEAHWRLLLQARAVENLCYVIGANICNRDHPSKPTWGGSAIIDPWGKVLAELADEEGFIIAEIDRQRIADLRASMPVLEHRRF